MYKVVYNNCYGGFGLSQEALDLGKELSGDPEWGDCVQHWELIRHEKILVQLVETLGEAVSGPFSELAIAEVEGLYRIDDREGWESIVIAEDYDWIDPTK